MKQTHKLLLLLFLSFATALLISSCTNLGSMFEIPEVKIISVELIQVDFVKTGRSVFTLLTGSSNANIRIDRTIDFEIDLPVFNGEALPWNSDIKVSIFR